MLVRTGFHTVRGMLTCTVGLVGCVGTVVAPHGTHKSQIARGPRPVSAGLSQRALPRRNASTVPHASRVQSSGFCFVSIAAWLCCLVDPGAAACKGILLVKRQRTRTGLRRARSPLDIYCDNLRSSLLPQSGSSNFGESVLHLHAPEKPLV